MSTNNSHDTGAALPRKTVLLVDDDESLLMHLELGLSAYAGLKTVTAVDGFDAVEKLNIELPDLVVTDIQMPRMDGLGLVSHLSKKHPKLPVVVVTGHNSPTTEHKLGRMGIVSFLKKPLEIDALAERIFDLLVGVDSGYVHGISIPSFLQLLQADQKTCCLRVTSADQIGYLHFVNGEIWDASLGDLVGPKAALEIVSWEEELTIDIQNIVRLKERTIDADVTFLVMEALRRKDEADGLGSAAPRSIDSIFALPERGSLPAPSVKPEDSPVCANPGKSFDTALSSKQKFKLFECLSYLKDVQGYQASAILSHTGELLVSHAIKVNADIEAVAGGFNEMFALLGDRSRDFGLSDWEETGFRSSTGVVLFRCSADAALPHLHAIAITEDLRTEGMMRIRLKRVLDEAAGILLDMVIQENEAAK